MGSCASQEVPLSVTSQNVEKISEQNLTLLSALVRFFIEKKEYGAAVKLMKIKDLTSEHYSTNKRDRQKLGDIEERLEEADRYEIRALLARELVQVRQANLVLKEYFKKFKGASLFFTVKDIGKYIFEFDSDPAKKETYKYLEREYHKSLKYNGFHDEFILELNFGHAILESYQQAIRLICIHTSYIFCSRSEKISYTQYIPTLR